MAATETTPGPVVALLIGMAGSGKSTLFHRLHYEAASQGKKCYFINLDPAAREVPVEANIDIRDTVDYKGVMREYSLGPNGAIVTSLNLFATQFSDVMEILDARANEVAYVIIDTPGQIEAFTWSASGQLIAEALASTFATTILYVVDTPRSTSPATFMSNMVYACSILHKFRLPLIACFNKTDVQSTDSCFSWMDDFEAFHDALDHDSPDSYVTSLHRSMSLVLDEFYRVLDRVGVSAATGHGIDDLWAKLDNSKSVYDATYGNEIRRRKAEFRAKHAERLGNNFARLHIDMEGQPDVPLVRPPSPPPANSAAADDDATVPPDPPAVPPDADSADRPDPKPAGRPAADVEQKPAAAAARSAPPRVRSTHQ